MTRQNHTQFKIGQRVQVSDGRERPPERFNRKLASWKHNNYSGHVDEIQEERDYSPYGTLILKKDDYPDRSYITFVFHVPLGGSLKVTPIPDDTAEALKVTVDKEVEPIIAVGRALG